ncbi:MAG: imidazoleglycerol-phosphate dehydratase HisB [Clostridiales bacterium]|nr:imidazoleglycerol-phosphate dehydratase HisB [Clostridiales bacterium]
MKKTERTAACKRKTKETDVDLVLNLDGAGTFNIDTGIGFFDHMLAAMAVHASLDLNVSVKGDLEVDGHHTVEDCGIVLGQALKEALGDFGGIARFGSMLLPMDDALARVALDAGGRPYLKFDAAFANPSVGGFDTCLAREFFRGLVSAAGMTLHIRLLEGENDHHSCEAIFKAFGHALRQAAAPVQGQGILSSKGVLV